MELEAQAVADLDGNRHGGEKPHAVAGDAGAIALPDCLVGAVERGVAGLDHRLHRGERRIGFAEGRLVRGGEIDDPCVAVDQCAGALRSVLFVSDELHRFSSR